MRAFLRVLGAFAVVMAIFFSTVFFLNYFSPFCPRGEVTELKAPFLKFGTGVAYVAAAPSLQDLSDSKAAPTRSSLLVCENNRALGPPIAGMRTLPPKGAVGFLTGIRPVLYSRLPTIPIPIPTDVTIRPLSQDKSCCHPWRPGITLIFSLSLLSDKN